tara:strand:- start:248 stop:508 length:261 start_codon:yes stop_codon:yes gene_type:complete
MMQQAQQTIEQLEAEVRHLTRRCEQQPIPGFTADRRTADVMREKDRAVRAESALRLARQEISELRARNAHLAQLLDETVEGASSDG